MAEGFYVDVEIGLLRNAANVKQFRDLKGRFTKIGTVIDDVYTLKSKEFLDAAAEELYKIPSSNRYAAWHAGDKSFRKSRRPHAAPLARTIKHKANIKKIKSGDNTHHKVFDVAYMNRTAVHWSAIEYGSNQNVLNGIGMAIGFVNRGSRRMEGPVSAGSKHVGQGFLFFPQDLKEEKDNSRGSVQRSIRAGRYLARAHGRTVGPQLAVELKRRIITDLSRR